MPDLAPRDRVGAGFGSLDEAFDSAVGKANENKKLNRTEALAIAEYGLGRQEFVDRKELRDYFNKHGFKVDPVDLAWCATYVGATLRDAGYRGPTSSMATSYAAYGKPRKFEEGQPGDVMVVNPARRNPVTREVERDPKTGEILRQLRTGDPGGHAGYFTGERQKDDRGEWFEMLGGNTGDAVRKNWQNIENVILRDIYSKPETRGLGTRPGWQERLGKLDEISEDIWGELVMNPGRSLREQRRFQEGVYTGRIPRPVHLRRPQPWGPGDEEDEEYLPQSRQPLQRRELEMESEEEVRRQSEEEVLEEVRDGLMMGVP